MPREDGYFRPGQSGNPGGRPKTKPIRDALLALLEIKGADEVARTLYETALGIGKGDVPALRELADRVDGKVAQALIGGDDDEPAVKIETIRRIIVRPEPLRIGHSDGGSVPAVVEPGSI